MTDASPVTNQKTGGSMNKIERLDTSPSSDQDTKRRERKAAQRRGLGRNKPAETLFGGIAVDTQRPTIERELTKRAKARKEEAQADSRRDHAFAANMLLATQQLALSLLPNYLIEKLVNEDDLEQAMRLARATLDIWADVNVEPGGPKRTQVAIDQVFAGTTLSHTLQSVARKLVFEALSQVVKMKSSAPAPA